MLRMLVVAAVWLACACGGGGKKDSSAPAAQPIENTAPPAAEPAAAPAPAPGSTEFVMMKFQEFSAKMCACTDSKCATDVSDEMTKWSVEMAKSEADPPKMTEEDQKRATEIGTKMGDCMLRATSASQPASP